MKIILPFVTYFIERRAKPKKEPFAISFSRRIKSSHWSQPRPEAICFHLVHPFHSQKQLLALCGNFCQIWQKKHQFRLKD